MNRRWTLVRELAIGILINLVVLGFARFAYGVILPFMQKSLGLSYTQAGILGAATALGYVGFVIPAGAVASRIGSKITFASGLLLCTVSLFVLGWTQSFWTALVWMFLAGVGTSFSYTPLVGYFMERYPQIRATVTGIISGGAGVGMLVVGFIVPFLNHLSPERGWRDAWLLFSVVGMLTFALALTLAPVKRKRDLNEEMQDVSAGEAKSHDNLPGARDIGPDLRAAVYLNPRVLLYGWIYFTIGLSYLIPPTFLLAFMIHAGMTPALAGTWVSLNGLLGILSGPLWGILADRFEIRGVFRLSILLNMVALFLPMFRDSALFFLIASLLLGLTVGGVIALLLASVSQQVNMRDVPAALGYVTFYFGMGQLLGPMIAGWMIDSWNHGFAAAFGFAGAALGLGLLMTFLERGERVVTAIQKQSIDS